VKVYLELVATHAPGSFSLPGLKSNCSIKEIPMNNFEKLYRVKDLLTQIRMSRSSIWAGVKAGTFPKPIRIGSRSVAWTQQQLDDWLASRKAS
jgi:prophage regulatory protein